MFGTWPTWLWIKTQGNCMVFIRMFTLQNVWQIIVLAWFYHPVERYPSNGCASAGGATWSILPFNSLWGPCPLAGELRCHSLETPIAGAFHGFQDGGSYPKSIENSICSGDTPPYSSCISDFFPTPVIFTTRTRRATVSALCAWL